MLKELLDSESATMAMRLNALNAEKNLLGLGQRFVVKIEVEQFEPPESVRVERPVEEQMLSGDWTKMLAGRRWTTKYRRVIELLRDNDNRFDMRQDQRPSDCYFWSGDRERMNEMFKGSNLPYRIRSTNGLYRMVRA